MDGPRTHLPVDGAFSLEICEELVHYQLSRLFAAHIPVMISIWKQSSLLLNHQDNMYSDLYSAWFLHRQVTHSVCHFRHSYKIRTEKMPA